MKQYIDKSALAAEIESKKNRAQYLGDNAINSSMQQFYDGMKQGCVDILSFLNNLEVKEVKEPTASDRGMAEEIIINLKRVEQDYHIDLTREMEWVRNKSQKGE